MVKNVPLCSRLTLLAVKGGPYSDAEVRFIVELLPRWGAQADAKLQGAEAEDGRYLTWQWTIHRGDGARPCVVTLRQYKQVEDCTDLEQEFAPNQEFAAAPNLRRLLAVSAPAEDEKQGNVAEKLNANVAVDLAYVEARASVEGWKTEGRLCNDEGRPVHCHLFTWKEIKQGDPDYKGGDAPLLCCKSGSGGHCGPAAGPQCASCVRL